MTEPTRNARTTQRILALAVVVATASCSRGDAEPALAPATGAAAKQDAPPTKLNARPVVYEGSCAGLRSHSTPSHGCAVGYLAFSCAPYESVRKDAAGCSACADIPNWISDPFWNFDTCGATFTVCVGAAPPHPRCTLAVKRDHSYPPEYFEVSPTVLTALGFTEGVHFGYSGAGFTGGFGSFDGAVYAGDVRERVTRAADPMSCADYAPGTRACDAGNPAHAETLFYCDGQQRWQPFPCNGEGHHDFACSNDSGRGAACCNPFVNVCRDPVTDDAWPIDPPPASPSTDPAPEPAPEASEPVPEPTAPPGPGARDNWERCEDDHDCASDYCACWDGGLRCLPSRDYVPREGC